MRDHTTLLLIAAALVACQADGPVEPPPASPPQPPPVEAVEAAVPLVATVGMAAPDFTLRDLDGAEFRLSEQRGKTVVLEWFNPSCPYVVRAHEKGALRDFPAAAIGEGVVWVAVNSGGPGKQGHGVELNREMSRAWAMAYPVLVDEDGEVGRMYEARTTPQMFVVDPDGVLVYAGAVDDDARGTLGEGRTNYVEAALRESAGGTVAVPETKSYGCSVKYGE